MIVNVFAAVRRLVTGLSPGERRYSVRGVRYIPEHLDRDADPGYRYFRRERARRLRNGTLVCGMPPPHQGGAELHHVIPFALRNGVDLARLNSRHGLALTALTLDQWYHTANTIALCDGHHALIHALGVPEWAALEVWQDGLPPPVRVEKVT